MYNRTSLHAVAKSLGDHTPTDISRRLKVAPATAWRLWNGRTAPSPQLVARVEAAYGIGAAELLRKIKAPA